MNMTEPNGCLRNIEHGVKMTALELYKKYMEDDVEPVPLERLRFFCSLAMSGQDWLDVEPFFDDVAAEINQLKEMKNEVK